MNLVPYFVLCLKSIGLYNLAIITLHLYLSQTKPSSTTSTKTTNKKPPAVVKGLFDEDEDDDDEGSGMFGTKPSKDHLEVNSMFLCYMCVIL